MGHEHAADNIYHICIIICATVVTYNEPNSKMLVHQVDPLDSGFLQDGRGREGETEREREREEGEWEGLGVQMVMVWGDYIGASIVQGAIILYIYVYRQTERNHKNQVWKRKKYNSNIDNNNNHRKREVEGGKNG